MAISTANTILKYSEDGVEYTKLLDITSYPDMGSAPNKIDTTDLSQTKMKTSILGLQEAPDLTFEANYEKDVYATVSALKGTQHFQLELGDNGVDGIFEWSGEISVFLNGGGVDEVRKMTVICSAETPIVLKE